jgi:hypothetical protein
MASDDAGGAEAGKRLRATARFLATYGRLPNEFDPETAMALAANIPAIESAQALVFARGIGMAFGDGDGLASAVHDVTGCDRLARNLKIRAAMEKANAKR